MMKGEGDDLMVDIGDFADAVKARQGSTTISGRVTIYTHTLIQKQSQLLVTFRIMTFHL